MHQKSFLWQIRVCLNSSEFRSAFMPYEFLIFALSEDSAVDQAFKLVEPLVEPFKLSSISISIV